MSDHLQEDAVSDDRPTEEPEPTGEAVPRTPEEPAAPDAHPTTPLPPFGDQPTEQFAPAGPFVPAAEPFAPAAPPVPPPVPPAGYVPPAAPVQPPAPGAGWAEVWSPGQTPEWHDAQFTTGGVATAPSRRGLAITALIMGIVAVVFALLGFIPVVGFAFLGLGGLLGVIALVLGIIAVSTKNREGRGMGLTGLILGALGVLLSIVAIVAQVLFFVAIANTGGSASASSQVAPTPHATASTAPTPEASPTASGTYDEQAYLDAVKPELLALWQTIQPSATALPWSDEFLVTAGQEIQSVSGSASDLASMRDAFVGAATSQSKGVLSNAQAGKIFDIVAAAANKYLAG
jgi:hypothetical protein